MDQLFAGLSRREAMLLLSACTFAANEADAVLDMLGEEQAEKLKARAAQIEQIPREKRVPFLVQEVKRLLAKRQSADLRGAEGQWLAHALRKERPRMVGVILRGLPARVASEVARHSGSRLKGAGTPPAIHPDVLTVIRGQLERKLEKAPGYTPASDRSMGDLTMLSTPSLTLLVDMLGASEIAVAVASLAPEAPGLFAAQLSAISGRALEEACQNVADEEKMHPDAARDWLAKMGDVQDLKNLVRRAGVKRLARACLAEGPEFLDRIARKHPSSIGRALASWGKALSRGPADEGDPRPDVLSALEVVSSTESSSAGAKGKE